MKHVLIISIAFIGLVSLFSFYFFLQQNQLKAIYPSQSKDSTAKVNLYSPRPLTLEKIFASDHSEINKAPLEKLVSIIVTGDIIPARSVNQKATTYNNFTWTVQKTADFLRGGDITFINLETPLIDDCPVRSEGMIFCGSSAHIDALRTAGVDVVSLANNHAGNHGEEAIQETISHLHTAGMVTTGEGLNIAIKEMKGIRFAFLGFNDIEKNPSHSIALAENERIKNDIRKARSQADVVIVTYHWGAEYQAQPDARQMELGRYTIDSGADLVIGNHPHWIQPLEFYKGKVITYAHGNFIFDQMWSQKTREGVVGHYMFFGKTLIDIEYFPIQIEDYGQPFFLEGAQKEALLSDMKLQSELLRNATASQEELLSDPH